MSPEIADSIIPIGRLDATLTGQILGFTGPNDIRALIADELLEPLGNPKQSCAKYFAWEDIAKKARDRAWLNKATDCVYGFSISKNSTRKPKNAEQLDKAA